MTNENWVDYSRYISFDVKDLGADWVKGYSREISVLFGDANGLDDVERDELANDLRSNLETYCQFSSSAPTDNSRKWLVDFHKALFDGWVPLIKKLCIPSEMNAVLYPSDLELWLDVRFPCSPFSCRLSFGQWYAIAFLFLGKTAIECEGIPADRFLETVARYFNIADMSNDGGIFQVTDDK